MKRRVAASGRFKAQVFCLLCVLALWAAAAPPTGSRESAASRLRAGRAALQDGLFDIAIKEFTAYIKEAETPRERAEGTLYLARALYWKGDFQKAADLLRQREKWAHGTEWEAPFLLLQARSLYEADQLAEALRLAERFEAEFPQHPSAPEAMRLHAKCLLRSRQYAEALRILEAFESKYPDNPEMADNLLDHAGLLLELQREVDAAAILERLVKEFPFSESAARGALWLGQLYLAQQRGDAARELFARVMRHPAVPAERRAYAAYLWADLESTGTNVAGAAQAVEEVLASTRSAELRARARALRGRLWVHMGKVSDGIKEVREAAPHLSTTDAAAVQLALADTLCAVGAYEEAVHEYQVYLDAFAEEEGMARALAGKAAALMALERNAEAAALFDRATSLEKDPVRRAETRLKAGHAYFAAGQYARAKERYEQVILETPREDIKQVAQFQLAETLARTRETAVAAQAFLDLAAQNPGTPLELEAWLRVAGLREAQGKWEEALSYYDRVAAAATQDELRARAQHGAGLVRYRLGEFAEALTNFERVVSDYPRTEWAEQAFYMRGWCAYLLGQSEKALSIGREFLRRFPNSKWSPDVLFWLGEYAFNRGEYAEAERQFTEVAAKYPENEAAADALYWAGRAAVAQRDFVRAIEHFTALAKNYPKSARLPDARFAQGDALTELGQFAAAILAFDEVIKLDPQGELAPLAYGRKGDCLFMLGSEDPAQYAEAQAAYRMAMDHPKASREVRLQAEYKIGRCREKLGQLEEAVERYMNVVYAWLGEAEKGRPNDPTWFVRAAFSAAQIRESQEKWDEAASIYKRVAEVGVPAAAEARERYEKIRDRMTAAFPREAEKR